MPRCSWKEHVRADKCEPCPRGSFILTGGEQRSECEPCPTGARCPGGSLLIPDKGFWQARRCEPVAVRGKSTTEKCLLLDACESELACVGMEADAADAQSHATAQCAPGYAAPPNPTSVVVDLPSPHLIRYEGRLCKTCSSGFARVKAADCAACPSPAQNIGVTFAVSVGIAAGATFMIAKTVRNAGADRRSLAPQVKQAVRARATATWCEGLWHALAAQMFKIFWTHLQLASFQLLYDLPWPGSVRIYMRLAANQL